MAAPFASYPAVVQSSPDGATWTTISGMTSFSATPKDDVAVETAIGGGGNEANLQLLTDVSVSIGGDYYNGNVGQTNFIGNEGGLCYVKVWYPDGSWMSFPGIVESYDLSAADSGKVVFGAKIVYQGAIAGGITVAAAGAGLPTDAVVAAANPGSATTVKTLGTTTALTAEACTLVSGNTYQITNTTHRVLDPLVARTYKGNAVAIPGAQVQSENFLFGKVTFTQAETAPITVDTGSYRPVAAIAVVKDWKITVTNKLIETSNIDNAGFKSRIKGISSCTGSFNTFTIPSSLYGGGATTFLTMLTSKNLPVLFEFFPGVGNKFRVWVQVESLDVKEKSEAALEISANFKSTTQGNSASETSYGWGL